MRFANRGQVHGNRMHAFQDSTFAMQVLVLGSGADGGVRHSSCHCPSGPECARCARLRRGDPPPAERTRSSIAVSCDGERWVLLNASPDIAQQIRRQPQLQPGLGDARSPFDAIVLMDAQIDRVSGLLSLRDGPPLDIYATTSVFEELTTSLPILSALDHYCGVRWHLVAVAGEQRACTFSTDPARRLRFEAMAIAGNAPPYSARRDDPSVGHTIALRVVDTATGSSLFYAPTLADLGPDALDLMASADVVMADASFWRAEPLSEPPARRAAQRRLMIHVDTCDPRADAHSAERSALERRGIELAYDGMALTL